MVEIDNTHPARLLYEANDVERSHHGSLLAVRDLPTVSCSLLAARFSLLDGRSSLLDGHGISVLR